MNQDEKITATQAAQRAAMSRERLLRRVQSGHIDGELIAGRWIIDVDSFGSLPRWGARARRVNGHHGNVATPPEVVQGAIAEARGPWQIRVQDAADRQRRGEGV